MSRKTVMRRCVELRKVVVLDDDFASLREVFFEGENVVTEDD